MNLGFGAFKDAFNQNLEPSEILAPSSRRHARLRIGGAGGKGFVASWRCRSECCDPSRGRPERPMRCPGVSLRSTPG